MSAAKVKAEEEQVRPVVTQEKAQHADLLRRATEEKENLIHGSLKSAQEEISKLKADLEAEKKARVLAEADAAKSFNVGELKAKELYANEALKFNNRSFKHG